MPRTDWDRGTRPPDNLADDYASLTDALLEAGVAWEEAEHEVQYEAGRYEVETLPGNMVRVDADGRNWTRVWPPEETTYRLTDPPAYSPWWPPAQERDPTWSPWRTPIYRDPRQQERAAAHIERVVSQALDKLDESLPLETEEPEIDPRIKKIRVIR